MSPSLAIEGGRPAHEGVPLPLYKVSYGWEEMRAVLDVFEQGVFCAVTAGAKKVLELEAALKDVVGTKHVVAFSSGANAQHASLNALDVGPGDEVIVPSLTFFSTAYTVLLQNSVPVFADVDLDTFTLDPADVRRKATQRTRAIVPVHWFGCPADMDGILDVGEELGLTIIEDCAHAFGTVYKGRRAGTMGGMACWSMQESKLITSAGDGGFLTTDDAALAERARMARDHGRARLPAKRGRISYSSIEFIGNHYRLTEIQAAFGLAQLRKLNHFRQLRWQHTEYLDTHLRGMEGLILQKREGHIELSYAYYPVRFEKGRFCRDIDEIARALIAEGVTAYPIAKDEMCHTQPLFTQRNGRGSVNCPFGCPHFEGAPRYGLGTLPNSERLGEELLLLPLYPDLSRKDLEDIVHAVEKVVEAYRVGATARRGR